MISRIILVLILLSGFQLFSASCNPAGNSSTDEKKPDSSTLSQTGSVKKSIVPQPDIETAETIVAGYFSNLNRKAGYQQFKGLGLKITQISQAADSTGFLILTDVTGRKRKSAGNDTATAYFEEKLNLKAFYLNNSWQADTLAY